MLPLTSAPFHSHVINMFRDFAGRSALTTPPNCCHVKESLTAYHGRFCKYLSICFNGSSIQRLTRKRLMADSSLTGNAKSNLKSKTLQESRSRDPCKHFVPKK